MLNVRGNKLFFVHGADKINKSFFHQYHLQTQPFHHDNNINSWDDFQFSILAPGKVTTAKYEGRRKKRILPSNPEDYSSGVFGLPVFSAA